MKSSQPSTTAHKRNRPIDQKRLAKRTMRYAVDYMDHAPVWQAPIFARGLFRPTQNGAPAQPLEVHFTSKIQGSQMHYVARSPQALNMTDQAVYFHLCQLMAQSKHVVAPSHEHYAAFKKALGMSGMRAKSPLPLVRVRPADLAAGIGLTRTGTNTKAVMSSLDRLSRTTLEFQRVEAGAVAEEGHSRFLGLLSFDTEVWVVLNLESGLHAHQPPACLDDGMGLTVGAQAGGARQTLGQRMGRAARNARHSKRQDAHSAQGRSGGRSTGGLVLRME